jgi:hypothetical protein
MRPQKLEGFFCGPGTVKEEVLEQQQEEVEARDMADLVLHVQQQQQMEDEEEDGELEQQQIEDEVVPWAVKEEDEARDRLESLFYEQQQQIAEAATATDIGKKANMSAGSDPRALWRVKSHAPLETPIMRTQSNVLTRLPAGHMAKPTPPPWRVKSHAPLETPIMRTQSNVLTRCSERVLMAKPPPPTEERLQPKPPPGPPPPSAIPAHQRLQPKPPPGPPPPSAIPAHQRLQPKPPPGPPPPSAFSSAHQRAAPAAPPRAASSSSEQHQQPCPEPRAAASSSSEQTGWDGTGREHFDWLGAEGRTLVMMGGRYTEDGRVVSTRSEADAQKFGLLFLQRICNKTKVIAMANLGTAILLAAKTEPQAAAAVKASNGS